MESSSCCPCSDSFAKTKKITVCGKEVIAKNYICSKDGEPYREKPEKIKLQLSICPTSFCAASCPFCIAGPSKEKEWIDLKKLEHVLKTLKEEDVVRGVTFTGGEPFTDAFLLNEAINMVYEIFGLELEVSLNTNGIGLWKLDKIEKLSYLDQLHISRHHYDDEINASLFGIKVPTKEEIRELISGISFKDLFVMNCLLLKDYIGTREEAHKFMDFANWVGVPKVSFITASPINDFVKSQQVRYEDVISVSDDRLLMTRCYQDFDMCKCQDGVYVLENGFLEEFYGRCTNTGDCEYTRGFVYGADNHLRCNYHGEILI